MRQLSAFILIVFLSGIGYSQDLHFSQYNENPSLLNPALTGATALFRASVNYKDQWKSVNSAFRTMGASVEMRGPDKQRKRAGKFGSGTTSMGRYAFGLSVYRDQAGDGKMGVTMGNLTFATMVPAGKRSFFSGAFQASLVQRRLDYSSFLFPNQFNGAGYDASVSSREDLNAVNFTHADYAAGLLWSYGQDEKTFITHKELKARLGASMYHIMEPTREFISNSLSLIKKKYVVHGDLLISMGDKLALAPSFMYQLQHKQSEVIGGVMLKYYSSNSSTKYTGFQKRTALGIGAYYRNADALIISMLLEMKEQIAIGLSYDINVSKLSAASGLRGGPELTLRYTSPGSFLNQRR